MHVCANVIRMTLCSGRIDVFCFSEATEALVYRRCFETGSQTVPVENRKYPPTTATTTTRPTLQPRPLAHPSQRPEDSMSSDKFSKPLELSWRGLDGRLDLEHILYLRHVVRL